MNGEQPGEKPVAILDGRAVLLDELRPSLLESAGRAVLEEKALDERLAVAAAAAGVAVTDTDVARERELLGQALALPGRDGAALSADDAARAVSRARTARGLGPVRYDALLRRTALMRKIVASEVVVTPEQVAEAYAVRYGERLTVRVIVTSESPEAQRLRAEVVGTGPEGESGAIARTLAFGERALRFSTDPSAPVGGLIEAFSPRDSRYPGALRDAAMALKPGEVSQPVSLAQGGGGRAGEGSGGTQWMLVMLMERQAASGPTLGEVQAEMESQIRVTLERRAMDRLAARLLGEAQVLVMDRSLGWAWERK